MLICEWSRLMNISEWVLYENRVLRLVYEALHLYAGLFMIKKQFENEY